MDNKLKLCGDYTTWSNVPFEDIVDRVSAQKKSSNLPYVEFEDIISGEGILNKNIYERHNVKNGIYFVKGDVLFGKLRPYLKNILLANFNGIAVGDFWVLRSHRVLPYILYLVVNSNKFMRIANISSGSKMPRSDWAIVSKAMITIPESTEEQQKIASYFQSLDSLIQTTSKELASLKQIKTASLQSMFPQEGKTVPKVRFKGFEGEWEKIPFGSFLKESYERSTVENEDILLSSAITGVYLNSELFGHQRGASNIGYKKIKKNMLILSAQNLHLGNANVNLRFEHGLISPAYKVYEIVNISPLFLQQWIKMDSTKVFFLNATTAGASLCRKNIVWDDLYKQIVLIPSKNEQVKIGLFFSNLDKQISLQTQRLEKLKQIKAACLDKMFV